MSDELPEGVANPHEPQALVCGDCGATSTVGVPDDGIAMQWECPQCGHRNETDGRSPAAVAVTAAALAHAAAGSDTEFHADGDEVSTTDERD